MVATHAKGTQFEWDGHIIAGLSAINGIEVTADELDVTTHDSPGAYRIKIPGFLDTSMVTLEGYFEPTDTAGQQALIADCNSRAVKAAQIIFPESTGARWSFNGAVMSCKIGDAPVDGAIPFAASIQPQGQPTFTVATSAGLTTPFFSVSDADSTVPAAAGGIYHYVVNVDDLIASVKVTPTAAVGTIKVNGATVASGAESGNITLGAKGSITTITIEVSETNKAPRKYTIDVVRAAA